MTDRPCENRIALVTGASRGLGAVIAKRLASDGARVALAARTLDATEGSHGSLMETVADISAAGGDAVAIRADLSVGDDRRRLVREATDRLGPVEILVNNAAVSWIAPVDEFSERRFRLMFEVQVWAAFELSQLVLPAMRAQGRGWILNISSRASLHPTGPPFAGVHRKGGYTAYGMCKAALERLTTGLAAEVHADGIAVNSLAPWDPVATPGTAAHGLADQNVESPALIAEAAAILCTADPRSLTGQVVFTKPFLAARQEVS